MTLVAEWVWQGMVVVWATAIALGRMRRLNAATRHAIWWFALGAVLLLPLVQPDARARVSETIPAEPEPFWFPTRVAAVPAAPDWVITCAIALWLGMVVFGLVRIASGIRKLVSLKARSRPLPRARRSRLAMWCSLCDPGRQPDLRISDEAPGASALGLGRPVILLPRAWVNALSDEDLDQIVMHEHAHLARHDDWLRLLQSVIASLAGLHPAVRFALHRIDIEREAACDDCVVSRTGAARRLAACLVNAATQCVANAGACSPAMIPAAVRSARTLRVRVHRLLDGRRDRSPRLARIASLASAIMLAAGVTVLSWVAPIVVFLETPIPAPGDARMETIPHRRWPLGAVPAATAPAATGIPSRVDRQAGDISGDTAVALLTRQALPLSRTPALTPHVREADLAMPLVNRAVVDGFAAPPPSMSVADREQVTFEAIESRMRISDPGAAAGDAAKRAGLAAGARARAFGTSIARFFTRGGKAVASSF